MHSHSVADPQRPSSITALVKALRDNTHLSTAQATRLLADLEIRAVDLAPWNDFQHGVRASYGRVLLDRGANFELMLMSWAPGDYSAIHDHGSAEWGAVRYFGCADHILFSDGGGVLSIDERMTMQPDDVFAVDRSLIHVMGNPTDFPFVSLHLYGREQASETITGGARIFDLYEEQIQRTDGGVFFCLPEHEIKSREPCPTADAQTRRLHHELMLRRVESILTLDGSDAALTERARRLRHQLGDATAMPVKLATPHSESQNLPA